MLGLFIGLFDVLLDPGNGGDGGAGRPSGGTNAQPLRQSVAHGLCLLIRDRGTPQSLATSTGTIDACQHPFPDHFPLKLGKNTQQLIHRPPRGGRGVEPLHMQVESDIPCLQVGEDADEVLQ